MIFGGGMRGRSGIIMILLRALGMRSGLVIAVRMSRSTGMLVIRNRSYEVSVERDPEQSKQSNISTILHCIQVKINLPSAERKIADINLTN